jgi:phosphatidylinositol alpha-1,6-mannosyltransferase
MDAPRILVATQNFPPDLGGIETLLGGFAAELARAGFRVEVFADRIRGGGAELAGPGFALGRSGGPRPLRRLLKRLRIARRIAAAPPRAIICDSWKSIEALPDTDVPILVLAHGMEYPAAPSSAKAARIRAALARAAAVAPNSAWTARLVQPYLTPRTRCVTVGLPIAPQQDPAEAALAEARRIAGGAGPVLLTLARLEPRKGIDMVIRAIPELSRRHPGLRYVVAGSGQDGERLGALAAQLGVADRVQLVGRVDDGMKAALFRAAGLFVMPARREGDSVEGFGLVYLEAAWHGLASLAGEEGGAADAVEAGRTGSLCDGSDPAAVEAAIASLLADPARLKEMGEAAAARVRADFAWPKVLPRYLDLVGIAR